MKKKFLISMILTAVLYWTPAAAVQPKGWEQTKSECHDAKSIVKEPEIEIMAAPSLIIVNTSRQVKIQVFSILGRLVSSETLPPGTSRLTIPAHGVYIVKVGELTCKVAV